MRSMPVERKTGSQQYTTPKLTVYGSIARLTNKPRAKFDGTGDVLIPSSLTPWTTNYS
jgi:hypothetical protein